MPEHIGMPVKDGCCSWSLLGMESSDISRERFVRLKNNRNNKRNSRINKIRRSTKRKQSFSAVLNATLAAQQQNRSFILSPEELEYLQSWDGHKFVEGVVARGGLRVGKRINTS